MLIATYDYWGYYNVCFLGDEVKDPAKTIPRALLLSICWSRCLYMLMNVSILGVVPWQEIAPTAKANQRLVCGFGFHAEDLWDVGGEPGDGAGDVDGVCVGFLVDAGLLAGAVRGGAGRQLFSGICPGASAMAFPYVSLLALGGVAVLFCFFRWPT